MFYPRLKVHDDSMGFSLADAGGLSKGLVCRGGLIFPRVFGGVLSKIAVLWVFGLKMGFWQKISRK